MSSIRLMRKNMLDLNQIINNKSPSGNNDRASFLL